jgi:RNA polymerase II subunit A-like phosphatase
MDSDDETGGSESEAEDSMPASQEEEADEEGVMPSEIDGQSPIDDLKTFDWGSAENELAEFMDSDSENDSDTSSVASGRSERSRRGVKRDREDTDDDDSDEGSTLLKKQRIANSRTTGLKTVKTPNSAGSESSLPTPGVTGDEDGDEGEDTTINEDGDEFRDLEDDLEAELEAELAVG